MKRTHQVALLLLLLFSMTQLGCSVIGYAIGSGIDYSIAPEVELPDASKLNKGDVLKLVWVDGDEDVATIQAVEDDSVTIVYVSHGQRITTTLKDISRESWLIAVTKLEPGHAGRGVFTTTGVIIDLFFIAVIALLYSLRDYRGPA